MNEEYKLRNFKDQFDFSPPIENKRNVTSYSYVVVLGMGGSHLAADILQGLTDQLLFIHSDYGLPNLPESILEYSLIIASSYSGNTEEVLDGYTMAKESGYSCAVVSAGGELLNYAKRDKVPYVVLPDDDIEPRMAIGYSVLALLSLMNEEALSEESRSLPSLYDAEELETSGRSLSESIGNFVPVFYTSRENKAIGYNWKITCNETGKIPAYANMIPESNHNELVGFGSTETEHNLEQSFVGVFLFDEFDDHRIAKRMQLTKQIYEENDMRTVDYRLPTADSRIAARLLSVHISDWFAYYIARRYGYEAFKTPIITKFKSEL